MGRITNLENKRYGMLTVGSFAGANAHRQAMWTARCDCGVQKNILSTSLLTGKSRSCGCSRVKHLKSRTVEFRTWTAVKSRCSNHRLSGWHNYGGRGIRVCDRWLASFDNFLSDMGPRPDGASSIDRINNDGDYEPGNCRWATHGQQGFNRRTTRLIQHNSKVRSLSDWAARAGLSVQTLSRRLSRGWDMDRALTETPRLGRPGQHAGTLHNMAKCSDEDVRSMRALFAAGASASSLAPRFNMSKQNANRICTGKTWKHLL